MDVNISAALSSTLASDLDFKGEFALQTVYPDAPNPSLSLGELGVVGLPLSSACAKQVIAKCGESPCGIGLKTVVNKDVRDTWEMDALKVQFCNPAWNAFMDRVVREVCKTLGVNYDASKPRAELYKLLVYETGSHFLPHVDTEKVNGMFASIIVVLPSQFTGGDAHTSHAGVKKVFNSSMNSMNQTTVLAWYTDVVHEIKPITSGFRFALSYNLLHTTTSLRPALSSGTGVISKLRQIFMSWNADESKGTDRYFHLLHHNYTMANLSASALKGSDAHIMALLDTLAKEVGFSLGLANLELRQSGSGDDSGESYYDRDRYGYGRNHGGDQDVDFVEIDEETLSVTNFVDPDGNSIEDSELELDDDGCLQEELTASGKYTQEYEGYMGNYAGTLERFYRRSVLVIWPRWSNLGGGNSDRRTIGALERLETLSGDKPTPEELDDFHYLCGSVKYISDEQDKAMQTLFRAAVVWNEVDLWTMAYKECCGPDMSLFALTEEDLQDACVKFGFGVLADSLGPVIVSHTSNERLQFVQSLRDLLGADEDSSESEEIDAFVTKMRNVVLDNIRPQWSVAMLQAFTNEVLVDGGAQMLRDRLLPQILKQTTVHNLVYVEQYLDWLHDYWTTTSAPLPKAEATARKEVITKVLKTILRMKVIFIPRTPNPAADVNRNAYFRQPTVPEGDPSAAVGLIGKCLDYDNPQLAMFLVDRISSSATKYASDQVKGPLVPGILFRLVPAIKRMFETCIPPLDASAHLVKMAETAINTKFQLLKGAGAIAVQREEVASMLDVAKGLENAGPLLARVISGLKALPWSDEGWAACMREFHARKTNDAAEPFGSLVTEMSKTYATKVSLLRSAGYYGGPTSRLSTEQLSPIMHLCFETGGSEVFSVLMVRVLGSAASNANDVETHLITLIPVLKEMAAKHRTGLASAPFASLIRNIVAKWMAVVLGPRPNLDQVKQFVEEVKKIGCSCHHCAQVVRFLKSSEQESMQLSRIGATAVKHVSGVQAGRMGRFVRYELVRTTPQSLNVQKNAEIARASKWKGLLVKGRQMLKSIGDETELKNIWGTGYVSALGPLLTKEQLDRERHQAPAPPIVPTKRKAPPRPVDPRDIIEIDSD